MKTRQEVEDLKKNWLSDATWDIEDTKGFEEYKEELLKYRLDVEKIQKVTEDFRITSASMLYNCTPDWLKVIESMQYRIKQLEEKIEK